MVPSLLTCFIMYFFTGNWFMILCLMPALATICFTLKWITMSYLFTMSFMSPYA